MAPPRTVVRLTGSEPLILVAAAAVLMALSLMLTMSRSGITAFGLSMVITGWFVARGVQSRCATDRSGAVSGPPCHDRGRVERP